MGIDKRIKSLVQLGKLMKVIGAGGAWSGFDLGITEDEFNELNHWIGRVKVHNGWFEEKEVRRAFASWGAVLTEEELKHWLSKYDLSDVEVNTSKTIAIIMAGNIPMVGLHDLICVYLLGFRCVAKLSSDDDILLPALLKVWSLYDPNIKESVQFSNGRLENFDALIATGSNNSARYFEEYFGKYPNIIRKNRTSVAVIEGNETEGELKLLADDIFAYYGLGCRNVTKLYLPKGYDLDKIFGSIFHYKDVTQNNKYGNNYDYHKSVFLLEGYDIIENGFILFKQDDALVSPIGTLYYDSYEDLDLLKKNLALRSEEIQCIVSKNDVPFGTSQEPCLWDYADGVDVVAFLLDIK